VNFFFVGSDFNKKNNLFMGQSCTYFEE